MPKLKKIKFMIHYFIISLLVLIFIVLISAMSSRDKSHNLLVSIYKQNKTIIMKVEEAVSLLQEANARIVKIGGETSTLLQKVSDLQAAADAATDLPDSLKDAINAVVTQAQTVDDLVPDAPQQPAEPPAETQG